MAKYTMLKQGDVITAIGFKGILRRNRFEQVITAVMPPVKEAENWSPKKVQRWIEKSNERMDFICKQLNDSSL